MSNTLPKLVILPLVDLIIDEAKPLISIYQNTLKAEHIASDEWALGELIGKPIGEVVNTMCHRGTSNFSEENISRLSNNISEQFTVLFGSKPKTPYSKEVHVFLDSIRSKGLKIGVTSWLNKETTEIALTAANLLDRIDGHTHGNSGYHHGTSPDIIFTLMRQIGIDNSDHVANVGKTKYDVLRGYHAQCKWNILIASDKDNTRWNAYPHTAIVGSIKEAASEIMSKSAGADFFDILNKKNRKRGK